MYSLNLFGSNIPIYIELTPFLLILSIIIFVFSEDGKPLFGLLFIISSAIMSIIWIFAEASFIMDFMVFFSYVSGFSKKIYLIESSIPREQPGRLFYGYCSCQKGVWGDGGYWHFFGSTPQSFDRVLSQYFTDCHKY